MGHMMTAVWERVLLCLFKHTLQLQKGRSARGVCFMACGWWLFTSVQYRFEATVEISSVCR